MPCAQSSPERSEGEGDRREAVEGAREASGPS